MLKQIFKKSVPSELLFNLLEKICLKTDTYYFIDLNSYKKMIFHEYHNDFLKELLNYYHASKSYYIEREFTYNSFINIIRQICKSNQIKFNSKIKYSSSKYNIDYLIYF
jgi:hypothetical protein